MVRSKQFNVRFRLDNPIDQEVFKVLDDLNVSIHKSKNRFVINALYDYINGYGAEYLEKQERTEEPVNIVVLQGTEGSTSMIGRTEGFNAIAEQYENWNILEQVSADYTTAKGHEVMEGLLTQYDDIDVVVSQNDDMTFGALEAIEEAGLTSGVEGDIIMISFDAVKAALKLVQDGIINVDIECNPVLGEEVEKVISALENGEAVDKTYPIEEKVFTIENVGEFIDDRTY